MIYLPICVSARATELEFVFRFGDDIYSVCVCAFKPNRDYVSLLFTAFLVSTVFRPRMEREESGQPRGVLDSLGGLEESGTGVNGVHRVRHLL
jgi:hypothetical protein